MSENTKPQIEFLGLFSTSPSKVSLPLFSDQVPAGFPSPAQDYVEQHIDLNTLLIQRPSATYLVRVSGESMTGCGIYSGDLLVVDRSLSARDQDIVIAAVCGEFTCKQLLLSPVGVLKAHHPDHKDIYLDETSEVEIFGVVTSCIKQFRGGN